MRTNWEVLAALALQKRGYLVCASLRRLRVGEIVMDMTGFPGVLTHQPFRVTAQTTWDDYADQSIAAGVKATCDEYAEGTTYYRVVTD